MLVQSNVEHSDALYPLSKSIPLDRAHRLNQVRVPLRFYWQGQPLRSILNQMPVLMSETIRPSILVVQSEISLLQDGSMLLAWTSPSSGVSKLLLRMTLCPLVVDRLSEPACHRPCPLLPPALLLPLFWTGLLHHVPHRLSQWLHIGTRQPLGQDLHLVNG